MEYTDTDGQKSLLRKDIAVMLSQKIHSGEVTAVNELVDFHTLPRINLHVLHSTSENMSTVKELVEHQKTMAIHSGK